MKFLCILLLGLFLASSLAACASAHHQAKPYGHTRHSSHSSHTTHGHGSTHHKSYKNGHHGTHHKPAYHKPKRQYPPGSYTLPGGFQSVCTGGTPPPCGH
jgi:hypothetical protein